MSQVGVVTDSSSCLPRELAEKYGILVASNHLIIGRKDYRDLTDITSAEFWKIFRELDGQTSTSGVNPGDFVELFEKLGESTKSIVCFAISARLSATYKSAVQAKELIVQKFPNLRIEVVDSKSSVGGLSFISLAAARDARAGKNLDQIVENSHQMISRVKYLLILESSKYLLRIGRAPEEAKKAAEKSSSSPIMGIVKDTGLVDMLGAGKDLIESQHKAVELMPQFVDVDKPLHVMLHYSQNEAEVKDLENLVTKQFHVTELYFSQFSPVVVAAIGPAVAVSFYS